MEVNNVLAHARCRLLRLGRFAMLCLALSGASSYAHADDDVKQACIDEHGQGQDEKEQGHITLARRHFTTCAQATCPPLVRDDCARLLDEVDRAQPSISFSARDASGKDLPDTSVFVDGVLMISRLDGFWHEIDPGMHVVRFEHGGRHQEQHIVVGAGEKGRVVIGAFEEAKVAPPERSRAAPARRLWPTLALGASAAIVVVGGALIVTGFTRVPDNCSVTKHECAAPPGDEAFRDASRAMKLSNAGWAIGGVGLGALAASLLWYFLPPKGSEQARRSPALAPLVSANGAGLGVSGQLAR